MNAMNIAIGTDIGGAHISCGAVDLTSNELIPGTCFESKVDNKTSADEIFNSWISTLKKSIDSVGIARIAGIGFAMPGPFDYVKGIGLFEGNEKYPHLFGVHVVDEIRLRLKLPLEMPIRFINDATAFAIAETWIGEGKGYSNVLALTLGTGFGSAFISGGIPVLEGETVPELGCTWHLPFKDGIADDYFSTRWFENSYFKRTGKKVNGVKMISELYDTEQVAHDLMLEFGANLGDFLAPWIIKFGAEHMVLGGNITGAFEKFGDNLKQTLAKHQINIGISLSVLKENAAIIGSARLVEENFFSKMELLLPKM
jgi:glucokinase